MPDSSQEQQFGNVDLTNSKLVSINAGGDAIVDSPGAQIIRQSYWSLFGDRTTAPGIDWDWAMQILKQQQPDIKKRLKDSLFGLAQVDAVEMESKRQEESPALALEAKKTLTVNGSEAGTIDPQAPIIATYAREDIDGSLLILGTPGAGKTITLLKLAEQLVGEAIAQPQTVIPIIFELSTWRDGQEIEAWLIEQLYENYGGNRKRKIYETWVERRVLLPLLDGLDELGMVRQKACTEAVNKFAKNWKVVVCCRVKEFQQAGVNLLNLRGKVQLQPLNDRQIELYLSAVGKIGLWEQIQTVPEMGRLLEPVIDPENPDYDEPGLLRVPLFISLAAQVYEKDQPLKGKADLFERYIDRQLSFDVREGDRHRIQQHDRVFKTIEKEPNRKTTTHTLSWLSRQLQRHNQVEFLIEKIQTSFLKNSQEKWLYRFLIGPFLGLSIVLGTRLFSGLSMLLSNNFSSIQSGLYYFFIDTSIRALSFAFYCGIFNMIIFISSFLDSLISRNKLRSLERLDRIEPIEKFGISVPKGLMKNIMSNMKKSILISSLLVGIFALIFTIYKLATGSSPIRLIKDFPTMIISIIFIIICMVIFGLAIGFLIGLTYSAFDILMVVGSFMKKDLKERCSPNQGISNSIKTSLFITLSFSLIGILIHIFNNTNPTAKIFLESSTRMFTLALLLVFPIFGGLACVKHFCLRLTISYHYKIPWNLSRFLTYCHERRLLQQIGGRYRFIHRELLEHFARM
jgi:hypothetical protein